MVVPGPVVLRRVDDRLQIRDACRPSIAEGKVPGAGLLERAIDFAELEALMAGPGNGRDNIWWVSAEVIENLRAVADGAAD